MDEELFIHFAGLEFGLPQPAESFRQFVHDPQFLNLPEDTIYPGVLALGNEIYQALITGSHSAAFVLAGLGGGKSTLAALISCAAAHWLLCHENPFELLGLGDDKPIAIVNMAPTQHQAQRVIFRGIRSYIESGPIFANLGWCTIPGGSSSMDSRLLMTSATFSREIGSGRRALVQMLSGSSAATFPLGMNVFLSVVDEISAFRNDQDEPQAEEIYEVLDKRRASRFAGSPHPGMILAIGTAGAEGDWLDAKMEELAQDDHAICHRLTTWEMKGRDRYPPGQFFHFAKLSDGHNTRFALYDDWPPPDKEKRQVTLHLADVPDAFRSHFQRKPIEALRDFGGVSALATRPFDFNSARLRQITDPDRQHPVRDDFTLEDWFHPEPGASYYTHVDLALGREGGDAAAMAMGHVIGEKRVQVGLPSASYEDEARFEFRPVIQVDLMLQITAGPGGEILFSEIRQLIYQLKDRGFDIGGRGLKWDSLARPIEIVGGVSLDSYQSADSIQILWQRGICAQVFSVDRTPDPYFALRECLADNRLDVYDYKVTLPDGSERSLLPWEYERLVFSGDRIDHSPHSSKDLCDCCAAIVHRIQLDYNRPMGGFV